MPDATLDCPKCQRQLRLPENLLGNKVKCPACGHVFIAEDPVENPPVVPLAEEPESDLPEPRKPPKLSADDYERRRSRRWSSEADPDDQDYEDDFGDLPAARKRRRLRRDYVPHRGGVILALGIISFFCFPIILGPIAWVMGNGDLREIRAGRMDPEGEGSTNAGRICGMISTIIAIVICSAYGLIVFLAAMAGGL